MNVAATSQIATQAVDPNESEIEKRTRVAGEKVAQIFKKILDGVEDKREEAVLWLRDYGTTLVEGVQDRADGLLATLQTAAGTLVGDMEGRQSAVGATV